MKPHGHPRPHQHAGGGGATPTLAPELPPPDVPTQPPAQTYQEFRPKSAMAHGDDAGQMMMPEAPDMHNPYKQGGYPHARQYMTAGAPMYHPPGVPAVGAAPPTAMGTGTPRGGPQPHYHRGGRGQQPRGAPHYMPRGAMNMGPRGSPAGAGAPGAPAPGGNPYYMPPQAGNPYYMPPQGANPYMTGPGMGYVPMHGMGMGMGMPMSMPVATHQHQPPPKREKKVLEIVNPKTGEKMDFSKGSSSTTATSEAKEIKEATKKAKTPPASPTKTSPKKKTLPKSPIKVEQPASEVKADDTKKKKEETAAKTALKSPQKTSVAKEVASPKTSTPKKAEATPSPKPQTTASPKKKAEEAKPKESKTASETKPAPVEKKDAEQLAPTPAPVAINAEEEEEEETDETNGQEKPVAVKKPKPANGIQVKNGKTTYTIDFLLSFREEFPDLPESATEDDAKWPSMEVVTETVVRTGRGGGGRGGAGWERGEKQVARQSSRGANGGGGGSQWQRSQEPPKRGRGERGGRGKGRGHGADSPVHDGPPVKPLERSANRWIPVKAASNLEAAKKKVQSIMNKMTREKFDRLANQLTDINMESLEMLQSVIKIIFDKALGEPHFCDMYADLCAHLNNTWMVWSFLKIVRNDDENKFYWTTMAESDSEVVGPFENIDDAIDDAETDDFEPTEAPSGLQLSEVRVRNGKFIKIWTHEDEDKTTSFYWSGQMLEDLGDDQKLHGPYDTEDYANRCAFKDTSFKRILLNACQEEFEKDNIYEELEENFRQAKKENKVTPEMETDYQEKRMIMKARMLGNIRFIGELYRKGMLQERIMHECLMKLMAVRVDPTKGGLAPLHPQESPDEENIEALCKLLTTMGKDLEKHGQRGNAMPTYFHYLEHKMVNDKRLCSRIIFMIRDVIDLRKNNWQPRRKELQTKTLNEIRKEAEREQQRPPASAPGGGREAYGQRGDRDMRRSNSSRDGGYSRATMAPVYQSQSMSSRSNNKMTLPRGFQRDDSVKSGPQGRPASFGNARRGGGSSSGAAPAGFGRRNSGADRAPPTDGVPAKSPSRKAQKPTTPPLSEDEKEQIASSAKSAANEFSELRDLNEAETYLTDLKTKFNQHMDVDRTFAASMLEKSMDAKDKQREAIFDLIEQLSLQKKSLSFDGVRFGLQKMLELAGDLWCDAPKLHLYIADLLSRFMADSSATGVSLDWIMCGCGGAIEDEIYNESLVGSDFLAQMTGACLQELYASHPDKAASEVKNPKLSTSFLSLFPDYDQTPEALSRWMTKYELESLLDFVKPACELTELLKKPSTSFQDAVTWIEKHVSSELRQSSLFATHACLLILGLDADSVPSADHCMLLMGLLGDVDMQTRFVAAILQTRSDLDLIKKLVDRLLKESAVSATALSKWLELHQANSVGRIKGSEVESVCAFVDERARAK